MWHVNSVRGEISEEAENLKKSRQLIILSYVKIF